MISDRDGPLTAERLREVLDYDPETGVFIWKIPCCNGRPEQAGGPSNRSYIVICVDKRRYLAHRLAWLHVTGEWPENFLDHRDLDRANNRWMNLRSCSKPQNGANRLKQTNNTSGFKGVTWNRQAGKWKAAIGIGGKHRHIGHYDCPVAAHLAYGIAAEQTFGEFGRAA